MIPGYKYTNLDLLLKGQQKLELKEQQDFHYPRKIVQPMFSQYNIYQQQLYTNQILYPEQIYPPQLKPIFKPSTNFRNPSDRIIGNYSEDFDEYTSDISFNLEDEFYGNYKVSRWDGGPAFLLFKTDNIKDYKNIKIEGKQINYNDILYTVKWDRDSIKIVQYLMDNKLVSCPDLGAKNKQTVARGANTPVVEEEQTASLEEDNNSWEIDYIKEDMVFLKNSNNDDILSFKNPSGYPDKELFKCSKFEKILDHLLFMKTGWMMSDSCPVEHPHLTKSPSYFFPAGPSGKYHDYDRPHKIEHCEPTPPSIWKEYTTDEGKKYHVSMVSLVDIKQGDILTADKVEYKNPGTGIPPKNSHKVIGKKAKIFIPAQSLIILEMFK